MKLYIVEAEYNGHIIPVGISPTEHQANCARNCLQQIADEGKTITVKYRVSDCMIAPLGYTDLVSKEMVFYKNP